MTTDAIEAYAAHVVRTGLADMPSEAVAAAKTFILDTIGVGLGGTNGPMAKTLADTVAAAGAGQDARVLGTGLRLPAAGATQVNAYQAHCQEFDCVHEAAVAHVMTIVLPAALAIAERDGGVSGAALIEAVVLGVDVAASLGVAAASGLRFFRPATVGAFGGVAAMGKLRGMDQETLIESFSLVYGQLCGTMQAHTEGSLLLAMQMGFNARNAVTASDMGAAGFTGPRQILQGDFGYFNLIEDGGDPAGVAEDLGRIWRITELAHKPFPSGRATHGILDGCLALQRQHGFGAKDVRAVRLDVPPLIDHLVGRPPKPEMAINYARLCARYVTAAALTGQGVKFSDFADAAYARADVQDLAQRVVLTIREDDPNALDPIGVEIDLTDGQTLTTRVDAVYGCPANPMTREAQIEKLQMNAETAVVTLPQAQIDTLITTIAGLEDVANARTLVDLTIGEGR